MSRIVLFPTPHLILGGAKSGKSAYAEKLVASLPPPYVYVATAEALDEEMKERVRQHQMRRGTNWETLEVPLRLVEVLSQLRGQSKSVLVDCLTLWLSNLLLQNASSSPFQAAEQLCDLLKTVDYPLVLVSNEVGTGIVPENALARQFRDLAGWANQQVASICNGVTCVMAGLPLILKETRGESG
jgi:adenosylcobinamide kinase/adenosylcobinamide-phosphate guanylyltransferase